MEKIAQGVLKKKLARIADDAGSVDPAELARLLAGHGIVGKNDVERASFEEKLASKRRTDLIMKVMGNGKPGVFVTLVEVLLDKDEWNWLGEELKNDFKEAGGTWPKEKESTPQPSGSTGAMSGTLRSDEDAMSGTLHSDEGEISGTVDFEENEGLESKTGGSKIVETSLKKRGLAIIVTCDYKGSTSLNELPGTNVDASEMKKTFEALDYHVILCQNKNATGQQITSTIKSISCGMHLFSSVKDKVVVFVFSGHGTTGDRIITTDGVHLSLEDRIVKPLLAKRKSCQPPVLFLIDACRGNDHLKLKSGPCQPKSVDNLVKGLIELNANFRLDYATIDDHVSYMDDTGKESRWLPTVARYLRNKKNKPFETIMQQVKRDVWSRFSIKQQPKTVDQLNCGTLYLHPRRLSLVTIFFVIGCLSAFIVCIIVTFLR